MTTVFEAARQADCVQAAQRLGLQIRRSGSRAYTCCLFHAERTPSMCLYPGNGGFYCFGCHAHGDAIALYAQALNCKPLEAARQVCQDFGFQYDERLSASSRGSRRPARREPCSPSADRAESDGMRLKGAPEQLPARRADAWALAKRLDAMREERADTLLTRMRSVQEILMQVASSKSNWDAVLDDAEWRRAMKEQSIARDQLAMLDGMTLPEFLEHVKERDGGTQ